MRMIIFYVFGILFFLQTITTAYEIEKYIENATLEDAQQQVAVFQNEINTSIAYCRWPHPDCDDEPIDSLFSIDAPWRVYNSSTIPVLAVVESGYFIRYIELWDGYNNTNLLYNYTVNVDTSRLSQLELPYVARFNVNKNSLKQVGNRVSLKAKFRVRSVVDYTVTRGQIEIVLSDYDLPTFSDDWHYGDTHVHSRYSRNPTEYAVPIADTKNMSKIIGIDWVTLTDHSFELDNYSWGISTGECNSISDNNFQCLRGEEVSCKNFDGAYKRYNHYLSYDIPTYILGDEGIYGNIIYSCSDVVANTSNQGGFGYVAHPFEMDDDPNKLLLRGSWYNYSLDFTGLEVWNVEENLGELTDGINRYDELLVENLSRHIFISAGSDAHGDFNEKFAKARTYCYLDSFTEANIFDALEKGHCILTSGPIITFEINNTKIGETATYYGSSVTLNITWKSTEEFGHITAIEIWRGDNESTSARNIDNLTLGTDYTNGIDDNIEYTDSSPAYGYYRLVARTNGSYYDSDNDNEVTLKYAYTNPIWVNLNKPENCGSDSCGSAIELQSEGIHACTPQGSDRWYKINNTIGKIAFYLDVPSTGDYDLYIDSDCSLTNVCTSDNAGNGVDEKCSVTNTGVYYVDINNWSGYGQFTLYVGADCDSDGTPDILDSDGCNPGTPTLLSPANNELVNDADLIFDWLIPSDPGGSGIKDYQLDVFYSNGTKVIDETSVRSSYEPEILGEDNYTWRVRAQDNAGNNGSWSANRTVEVNDTTRPESPLLSLCSANLNQTTQTYTVEWYPSTDASGINQYTLQESTSPSFGSPVENTTSNSYLNVVYSTNNTYYYRVKAKDNVGLESNWSNTCFITTATRNTTFATLLVEGWNLISIPLNIGDSGGSAAGGSNQTTLPKVPETYYGYVTINGTFASEGKSITVEVDNTNEVVGNTTVDSEGEFTLNIAFGDTGNMTDGMAEDGNYLIWKVDGTETTSPTSVEDKAESGKQNPLYIVRVGDLSVMIAGKEPDSSTASVTAGDSITFNATAIGSNTNLISYKWSLDGVAKQTSMGGPTSWTYYPGYGDGGTKNVTLDVTDGTTSNSTSWTLTVDICSGSNPPESGDWNITINTSCTNTNITLAENANLNVIGNVTLSFENVTLTLDNGTLTAYDEGNSNSIIQDIMNTIIEWIT